ncbi:hypothetical protein HRI_001458200 [Hibiscus trionum]|uniref:Uncharacterized protein n=1 Tax=Hibiscus trionum TaxID=183268 RepID=A0A9W7HJB0_HIBTR|nr:hypothetical protein HRI_001458200 [Hibiscus trionum]
MWDSDEDGTPFWLETTDNYRERCRRFFFNTGVLLILLLAIAFAFFFIVSTSKPQDVKKSLDSLILVIVLFAVICAFLNKTSGDDESPRSNGHYEFSTPEHDYSGRERCRRFFFNAGVFLVLILAIAFAFIFIVIPSFLCFTSNIFKHHFVKKNMGFPQLSHRAFRYRTAYRPLRRMRSSLDSDTVRRTKHPSPSPSPSPSPYQAPVPPPAATIIEPSAPPIPELSPSQSPRERSDREEIVYYELKSKHSRSPPPSPVAPPSLPSFPPYQASVPPLVATTIKPSAPPALVLPPSPPLKVARMKPKRTYEPPRDRSEREKTVATTIKPKPPPPAAPLPSPPPYRTPVPPPVATTIKLKPSAPPAPALPPSQPLKVARMKPKPPRDRSEHEKTMYNELTNKHSLSSPPPPAAPPPPPPPPSPPQYQVPVSPSVPTPAPELPPTPLQPPQVTRKNKHSLSSPSSSATPPPPERRSNRSQKKKGGVTKEFLKFLRRKKKKQRQRSVENLDEFFNLATLPLCPSPPPPPPPPRPSFYNISTFKKNKGKKQHSVPPPPPPPSSLKASASKRDPNKRPVTIKKPPSPINIRNVKNVEECTDSGNESSSSSIPQPPPPPPFNIPVWQYEVLGDFVRLKSINGSRSRSHSNYPFGHEASSSDGNKTGNVDDGESPAASSDLNTKADNLIARVKAGWKLEKINSVKRRSNLGLDPGPSNV